jgi:DnaJ-domain-containing protein 1
MTAYIYELESRHAPWRWALAFDYSPTMVAAIKDNIPSRQRKWCPEIRQWWFKADAHMAMLKLAEQHCGSVQHVQDNGAVMPALPAEMVAAYRTLHLQPTAPDDLIKAAYRVMCKLHHPDKGGMTREMQRVNEAYGRLVQR